MSKKEALYIFKSATKKMAFKVLLVLFLCCFVGICFFNRVNVKAFSGLANINRTVNLIEGDSSTLLYQEQKILNKDQTENINMQSVGLIFNANTKLEYVFEIQSTIERDCIVSFNLKNDAFKNILIQYQIENEVYNFEELTLNLSAGEILRVTFWISIENPAFDANMNGNIELSIGY